jgi:predicted nucleic acid-binding protein
MAEVAYFDSCIFMHLLAKKGTDQYKACEALWTKATQDKPELAIYTSVMAIVECNKIDGSKASFKEQSKQILAFFAHPVIIVRATDRFIAERAQELTRAHADLTNIDAIHVATALERRVAVLYTFDGAKERGKGKRSDLIRHHLKIGNPPLRIEAPPDPLAGTLTGTLFDPEALKKLSEESATDMNGQPPPATRS